MRKAVTTIAMMLLMVYAHAAQDSLKKVQVKAIPFIGLNIHGGLVLPTNDYIINSNVRPTFSTYALRFGYKSSGSRWQDYAYGMPYAGIGLMGATFFDEESLGNPYTLYAFQGLTVAKFTSKFKINFEWNLGASFNWKPYDPFDNPHMIALGSSTNVFVGLNVYANFELSDRWDLNYGFGVSHYSNGASKLPNKGLNMASSFVALSYNFNKVEQDDMLHNLVPPIVEPHLDYDVLVNISSRQTDFDTVGTNLPSKYLDKNFSVYGFTFAPMIVTSYKYKYGIGTDLLYDESSGARAWRELNPLDGKLYDRVKLGRFKDRISLGVSVKGEVTLPMYSIFANFGYNVIQGNRKESRIYQVIGVKAYLKENLFGTFGIRATHFSSAQYLYWSLGYTFNGQPLRKAKRDLSNIFSMVNKNR